MASDAGTPSTDSGQVKSEELFRLLSKAVSSQLYDYPEPRRVFDVERFAYIVSAWESAQYFCQHMSTAQNLVEREKLTDFAASLAKVDGLVIEFGVADGASIRRLAGHFAGTVFGFDSFEGLPEDWSHFQRKGRYSRGGALPVDMPPNVQFVKGWFDQTLSDFLQKHEGAVKFLHLDCDLYSSTKTVFEALGDRIVPGTIILFDEYFNYPGWQQHEYKAFQEFVARGGVKYEYLGFASSYCSVAVRVLESGTPGGRTSGRNREGRGRRRRERE